MLRFQTLQQMFQRYRKPGDLVFAVLFIFFALFLLWNLTEETKWLNGKSLFAQPRFWPAVGVIGMVGFGVLHWIGSVSSPRIFGRGAEVWFWIRSLEYVAWFLAYVLSAPYVGFLPASIFFAVVLAMRAGYRAPRMLLAAAGTGLAIVLIFRTLLQVKIPGGALYEYLPDAIRLFMLSYM